MSAHTISPTSCTCGVMSAHTISLTSYTCGVMSAHTISLTSCTCVVMSTHTISLTSCTCGVMSAHTTTQYLSNMWCKVCLHNKPSNHTSSVNRVNGDSESPALTPEQRLCHFIVLNEPETGEHLITWCSQYTDIRNALCHSVLNIESDFMFFNDTAKMCFIISEPELAYSSAKSIDDADFTPINIS